MRLLTALIFDIWHVVKEFLLILDLRKIKNPTTYSRNQKADIRCTAELNSRIKYVGYVELVHFESCTSFSNFCSFFILHEQINKKKIAMANIFSTGR